MDNWTERAERAEQFFEIAAPITIVGVAVVIISSLIWLGWKFLKPKPDRFAFLVSYGIRERADTALFEMNKRG